MKGVVPSRGGERGARTVCGDDACAIHEAVQGGRSVHGDVEARIQGGKVERRVEEDELGEACLGELDDRTDGHPVGTLTFLQPGKEERVYGDIVIDGGGLLEAMCVLSTQSGHLGDFIGEIIELDAIL